MGLLGPLKKDLPIPDKLKSGIILICKQKTSTTTIGKQYRMLNHFIFCNKKNLYDRDFFWRYDQFVTLKNDYGYIVKINLNHFELKSDIEAKEKLKDQYESDLLNILAEAHQLIPQRYE